MIFDLVFFLVIIAIVFGSNPKKRFLKLQASLPTSKTRSLAKGLVEVQGKLVMQEPLTSKIKKVPCIGYRYVIERLERDSDGRDSYSTIHEETQCNPFAIEDDTGKVFVLPEGISFVMLEATHQYHRGGKRYTETLLLHGQEMLLIGYADAEDGVPFLRKDPHNKLLGITPVRSVTLWNKYRPLLHSFLWTCAAIVLCIIIILLI